MSVLCVWCILSVWSESMYRTQLRNLRWCRYLEKLSKQWFQCIPVLHSVHPVILRADFTWWRITVLLKNCILEFVWHLLLNMFVTLLIILMTNNNNWWGASSHFEHINFYHVTSPGITWYNHSYHENAFFFTRCFLLLITKYDFFTVKWPQKCQTHSTAAQLQIQIPQQAKPLPKVWSLADYTQRKVIILT